MKTMNNLNILLISENYIKERSTIMENVEIKFIKPHILESQDIHIQDILGNNLYKDIINEFELYKIDYDSGVTGITVSDYVSTQNLTLINTYIRPTLLYYTLYESTYDLSYKITNKGIVNQYSDYSNNVENSILERMRGEYLNKAEYYGERMRKFLLANTSIYSKYLEGTGNIDDINPDTDSQYLSNGWYLKDVVQGIRINGDCC